jgi:ribosomal protein S18 acetylase RimI-like enzyme
MGELGMVRLENLVPRHEAGLNDLFCALSANGDGNLFYPHPLTPEEARRLCSYAGLDQYFVATVNGRILGYGMLRGWDEGYAIPSLGLATHPDARSQGLGEFLMRGLIQQARNRRASQLRLTVDASRGGFINFFVRHGFVFSPFKPGRLLGMLDLQKIQ